MATLAVLAASLVALYGDVAFGEASDFRGVVLRSRYAVVEPTADGHEITGQTLGVGSSRFTYRVDVLDSREGRLSIEVVPET